VIAWNEAIEKFTGVPADAMLGKGDLAYAEPFFGTKHKMLLDLVFEPDEEILRENHLLVNRIPKGQVTAITRGKKRDGSESTIWAKATPLYDARGNFIAVVGIVRDVSTVFGDVIIGYTPPE
jgi:PAS domain S-box-containing protein